MILIILSIIMVTICYILSKKVKNKIINKYLHLMIKLIIISTVLELSLFNFRHFESLNYEEIKLDNYTLGVGLKENNDGTITLLEKTNNYIEINNINEHINNINIDVDGTKTKNMTVGFGFTDEANKYYSYLKNQPLTISKSSSDIFRTHFSGSSPKLKITFETSGVNNKFKINEISINKVVPYNITIIRPIILIVLILILYIFRPSSLIYQYDLFDKKAKKICIVTLVATLCIVGTLSRVNRYFVNAKFDSPHQYQYLRLTEAFSEGHTYLDIKPSSLLKEMTNPYDRKARDKLFKGTGRSYLWDTAYYNDKYYVYFGVAPVITYFLPYYLLTGTHIKVPTCVTITTLITIIGIFLLLYEICKKWFKKVKLGHYLLITLTFIFGAGFLYIVGRPDHYNLPIIMAIMFSIYGLTCWIKAYDSKHTCLYLFIGSTLLAGVAASRPQILLTSFLAIPLFYNKVFKERKLLSKSSIKETLSFMFPYIVIATLLMIYNYVRFASPFDFGANYNLTTNDMTRRGFVFDRIPLGLFYYLIGPINLIPIFPFIMRTEVQTDYIGTTISEKMGAGFLVINFICLACLYLYKRKDEFKDKCPYYIAILSIISSIIIIIADTEMAGILPRYICDFGFLLYLATSITLFHILCKKKNTNILTKIIYGSFIIVFTYNILFIFSDNYFYNSSVFNYLRQLFIFWQ